MNTNKKTGDKKTGKSTTTDNKLEKDISKAVKKNPAKK